jgi:hypothetical protein
MAQAVEHLPSKHSALSSNTNINKKSNSSNRIKHQICFKHMVHSDIKVETKQSFLEVRRSKFIPRTCKQARITHLPFFLK